MGLGILAIFAFDAAAGAPVEVAVFALIAAITFAATALATRRDRRPSAPLDGVTGPSARMSPDPGADRRVRQPVWSGLFTHGLAARVPQPARPLALTSIKAIHTVIFVSIAGLVAAVAWDGVRGLPRRRTAFAAAVALAESLVYASNNRVCPLTPLAEELGAASGSVTDIFLPEPSAD